MSTKLSSAVVESAKASVEEYVKTITGYNDELKSIIDTLTTDEGGFYGQASDGYKEFYTQKVVPAVSDKLVGASDSLTASINAILDNIKTQLIDTVDKQLGDNNRNPG